MNHVRRNLANEIVFLETRIRVRKGGDLFGEELDQLWQEARNLSVEELEGWVASLGRQLAALPPRKMTLQFDLDFLSSEEAA